MEKREAELRSIFKAMPHRRRHGGEPGHHLGERILPSSLPRDSAHVFPGTTFRLKHMTAHLDKPVTRQKLLQIVRRVLDSNISYQARR